MFYTQWKDKEDKSNNLSSYSKKAVAKDHHSALVTIYGMNQND